MEQIKLKPIASNVIDFDKGLDLKSNYPNNLLSFSGHLKNPNHNHLNLNSQYETDFVAWAEQTAEALERNDFASLDLENLIEEVYDLARRLKERMESQLVRLFMHLLKWDYQPDMRSSGWLGTIREARKQILKLQKQQPSLKNYRDEIWHECYQEARDDASFETKLSLSIFPSDCPYSIEDIINPNFPMDPRDEIN